MANQSVSSISPSQQLRAGTVLKIGETESHFSLASDLMQPIYGQLNAEADRDTSAVGAAAAHPLSNDQGRFSGVILAEYSMEGLAALRHPDRGAGQVRGGPARRQQASFWRVRSFRNALPCGVAAWQRQTEQRLRSPVAPVGNDLILRAQAWRTSQGLVGSGLFWLVSVLSVMTAWMLIGNWRHTRRRIQAQKALVAETNFRRAMENSMLTGMRALGLAWPNHLRQPRLLSDDGLERGRFGRALWRPFLIGQIKTVSC
jgi:hypothetical protein